MSRCFPLVFAAVVLGNPGSAKAQKPNPEQVLQMAEKYYEQLEYETALKALIQVHQLPGVTPMQRARAFLYMGVCFTALGNAENAVLSFMELLKIKNNFRLPPGISPSIRAMFKEALKRLKMPEKPPPGPPGRPGAGGQKIPVAIVAKSPKKAVAGKPVDIKIEVADPRGLVKKLLIRWRRKGGPDFSNIRVPYKRGTKVVTGRIPGATVGEKEGDLLYFVEAQGRGGMTLAHAGKMDMPMEVTLTTPPKPKSKWAWWAIGIGGGLAVVGGVVAAILLTRGDNGPNGIPPNAADVTVTIH